MNYRDDEVVASSDGRTAYVSIYGGGRYHAFSVIDLVGQKTLPDIASRKVIATLDAKVFSANRLKFTPDGKLVLISSLSNGDLVIYDAASRKEHERVKIGHGAAGILMDADAGRAFIACSPDNYTAILDLKTLEVTGHLDVGGEPDGLAWAVRP